MKIASANNNAEEFDHLTDSFIETFSLQDEELLIIGLKILIERLLKKERDWPEDIFGFADYVEEKYEKIKENNRIFKHKPAMHYVDNFLSQEIVDDTLLEVSTH